VHVSVHVRAQIRIIFCKLWEGVKSTLNLNTKSLAKKIQRPLICTMLCSK